MNPLEIDKTSKIVTFIVNYFRNYGYKASYEIVDKGKIEKNEGIDAVIIVGGKMFGIQTKRLYLTSNPHYKLNEEQHDLIINRDWVFYAFPENIARNAEDNILHRTLFSSGGFKFKKELRIEDIPDGIEWRKIEMGIHDCSIGLKINDENEKAKLIPRLRKLFNERVVSFSIDTEKKYLKVSGFKDQIDLRSFRKDKKKIKKNKNLKGESSICPCCGRPLD